MKIVFVQPESTGQPHMGIMYLSSSLKKAGYNDIIFCAIMRKPISEKRSYEYYKKILKEKPDIVGVTSTTPELPTAFKICKDAKESGATVILGGPGPSSLPLEILSNNGSVDLLVVGEAENTIADIVKRIEDGKDFDGIKGTIYRKDGKIIRNEPNPLIRNLDDLPYPDRDCLDIDSYHTPLSILTSRGCPYDCIFCFKPVHGRVWRSRSPENVANEIEYLINEYPKAFERSDRRISVQDDIFNLDLQRAKKIADEIVRRKLDLRLTFVNGFHVRTVDYELFEKLKKAGCIEVWFGVDAGSEKIQKNLGKAITLDMVKNAVHLAKNAGIERIGAHFIIGLPGETPETAREALEFAKSLNLDVVGFNHANILPGTKLWDWVQENGRMLYSTDNLNFSMYRQLNAIPTFETKEFTKEQRVESYEEAVRFADNLRRRKALSSRNIKKFLSQLRSVEDVKWALGKLYFFFSEKDLRLTQYPPLPSKTKKRTLAIKKIKDLNT